MSIFDSPQLSMRAVAGPAARAYECLTHEKVESISFSKEEAIKQIEKIHEFLSLALWKNDLAKSKDGKSIFMDEEPYCNLVDEVRSIVGTGILPDGTYMWKGADQIEGLKASLQTRVQDITAHMSVDDLRINHMLNQLKEFFEIMRKIGDNEKESVDSMNRKMSKAGG